MTEHKNKYRNGKIYKIPDIGYTKCYVGSTYQELSQRMAQHRIDYKRYLNGKRIGISSVQLFDEFGLEHCKIELLEEYPCENKQQLNKREGEYIKKIKCVNKLIAGRNDREYYQDNKEKMKQYREDNKEHVIQYRKQYKEENKEKILEQSKQYRQDKSSVPFTCLCGCTITRVSLSKHMKTKNIFN